jgi:hypothetical protein
MCYSAQVESKWKCYAREMEARWDLPAFHQLIQHRLDDLAQYRLSRGFDLEFSDPQSADERAIKALVDQYRQAQVVELKTEIFT